MTMRSSGLVAVVFCVLADPVFSLTSFSVALQLSLAAPIVVNFPQPGRHVGMSPNYAFKRTAGTGHRVS